jgi:folate-binding protein YgfZ
MAALSSPLTPDTAGDADNRWRVDAADFAKLQAGGVRCRLDDHAVLEFDGPEAVPFLQAQLTADVAALGPRTWALGGYCTPKGRLLAIFQAWRYAGGVRLLLPAAIAGATLKRLSMYILRAKVRARDASADWALVGLAGDAAGAALQAAGATPVQTPWESEELDAGLAGTDARLAAMPRGGSGQPRWLAVIAATQASGWEQRLAALPAAGRALWWWTQIEAGVPAILPSTSERFVPQSINLEVLGGVNFRKGCYPGQEIVARSQYLGKLRRRMVLAHAADIGPTGDVFAAGKAEAVGRIVLAASAPGGGWDALIECAADAAPGASAVTLHAGSPQVPELQARPLPYTLFDPTA